MVWDMAVVAEVVSVVVTVGVVLEVACGGEGHGNSGGGDGSDVSYGVAEVAIGKLTVAAVAKLLPGMCWLRHKSPCPYAATSAPPITGVAAAGACRQTPAEDRLTVAHSY